MANIQRIVLTETDSGDVYLRNGVVLAYFIDQPVHAVSESLLALFDAYLGSVPTGTLKWTVPSATAEEWQAMDGKTISRCRAALAPDAAKKRRLTAFHLSDVPGTAPGFSFDLVGKPLGRDFPDALTLVQMVFPIDVLDDDGIERFVEGVRRFNGLVDFTSGYCSPALLFSPLHRLPVLSGLPGIALRHPGYDVHANDMARLTIGANLRGARWITLLGSELLAKVGGPTGLRTRLNASIVVEEAGMGTMIRAGRVPEIGDVNRRVQTPLLRDVAKVLEPITSFGESDLIFGQLDETLLLRWERRLLD